MIKKIVCAALTTALLISSAVGVMAAEYSTTTTYGAASGEIVVSSTVTGVTAGDTLTYLAYEDTTGNGMDDNEVVYIDQVTATGTSYTFTYVADTTDIGAQVLYGGKTSAGAAMTMDDSNIIPGLITVEDEAGNKIGTGSASSTGDAFVKVTCTVTNPIADVTVKGVTGSDPVWFGANGGFWIESSVLTEDVTLVVKEGTAANVNVTTVGAKQYVDEAGNESIVVLANVTGVSADYGVIISSDNFANTAVDYDDDNAATATNVKYQALGCNDAGDYLIQVNYPDGVAAGTYSAKAYAAEDADDGAGVKSFTVEAAAQ